MTTNQTLPTDQYVRRVRRVIGISQRQLARYAGVSERTVARIERGQAVPSLPVFSRLLCAAGYEVIVVDADGRFVEPMQDLPDNVRDRQGRRFPAHLDVVLDPEPGEWWGDLAGLARPPETFRRDPADRERRRERYVRDQRLYRRASGYGLI